MVELERVLKWKDFGAKAVCFAGKLRLEGERYKEGEKRGKLIYFSISNWAVSGCLRNI